MSKPSRCSVLTCFLLSPLHLSLFPLYTVPLFLPTVSVVYLCFTHTWTHCSQAISCTGSSLYNTDNQIRLSSSVPPHLVLFYNFPLVLLALYGLTDQEHHSPFFSNIMTCFPRFSLAHPRTSVCVPHIDLYCSHKNFTIFTSLLEIPHLYPTPSPFLTLAFTFILTPSMHSTVHWTAVRTSMIHFTVSLCNRCKVFVMAFP